jgi:DNA-binding LytR/AlgR family response regulator
MLTDIAMPGMSGVELARRARATAPCMKIAFASGYADVQTFGADLADEVVLKKPYRIHEVAARIEALLAEQADRDNVVRFPAA